MMSRVPSFSVRPMSVRLVDEDELRFIFLKFFFFKGKVPAEGGKIRIMSVRGSKSGGSWRVMLQLHAPINKN